jgi:excisionase family DNA binding protein
MKSRNTVKTSDRTQPIKVLTVCEVSDYLHVHSSTVYRLLKHNQIPAFHMGSDWRFNIEAINQWCLRQEKPRP